MFSFISGLVPKGYLVIGAILVIASIGGYINHLQSSLEDKETELSSKNEIIKSKDADIQNVITGYEATLEIEKKLATEKAVTQEQKVEVVTKYQTLTNTIKKRGEIKQDEKSNFTVVTF